MSQKTNGVCSKTRPQQSRRTRALENLEGQLKSGTKTQKGTMSTQVPLSEADTKRINKVINNLKAKL